MLTEENIELLAQRFAEKLQQARSVSDSEHYDHHAWIAKQIKREEAWTELYIDARKSLVRWGLIGMVGFILYAVWEAIIVHARNIKL